MDNSHLSDNDLPIFHNDYVDIWKDLNGKFNDEPLTQKYQELSALMGDFAKLNNQFISIFNTKSQKVLYMSDNYLDVLGYNCTDEEYKKWSTLYWMRDLPFAQSWFFMQMSLFYKNTAQAKLKQAGHAKSINWYMHNFKLKPPKKELRHISLTCSGLEFTGDGSMVVMMLIIKDVGNLIKDTSPWWAEFHINGLEKFVFHQNETKFKKGSILSEREKDILQLIIKNKDSKQIADQLNISPQTVDKHRKNMIEITGAKDISCLLQLCEIGNII